MIEQIYATLSVYGDSTHIIDEVTNLGMREPSRRSRSRDGEKFSAHYSSEHMVHSDKVNDHIQWIVRETDFLTRAKRVGGLPPVQLVLWLFVGVRENNSSLILMPHTISWLHDLGAEVCMDIWVGSASEVP